MNNSVARFLRRGTIQEVNTDAGQQPTWITPFLCHVFVVLLAHIITHNKYTMSEDLRPEGAPEALEAEAPEAEAQVEAEAEEVAE